ARAARGQGLGFWVGVVSPAALRRAARLRGGWVPWQLGPDEFAGLVERARRLRAESGGSGNFELVAPLGAPPQASADAIAAEAKRWRAAGATSFHVGIGADSLQEVLGRLAWFGAAVASRIE